VGDAAAARSKRFFFHVGSPKTGTTFLQQVLWSHKELVREHGLLLPLRGFDQQFVATRAICGRENPRGQPLWHRLLSEADQWPGDSLFSHELLAQASAEEAAAAVATAARIGEVHLILTARDLMRQVPAEWQQHVKSRSTVEFETFLQRIRSDRQGSSWFWKVQDIASVLARWGATLPRDQVHVVTVPPRGSEPRLLWDRFASVLDLEDAPVDLATARANQSLKLEQTELLRRLNETLGERLAVPGGRYPVVVKDIVANQVLAGRPGSPLRLDAEVQRFIEARALQMVREVEKRGYHVVGDLGELLPVAEPDAPEHLKLAVSDAKLLEEALETLAEVADRLAASIIDNRDLRRRMTDVGRETGRRVSGRLTDRLRRVVTRLRAVLRQRQQGVRSRSGA
jgi:hypothetical protein